MKKKENRDIQIDDTNKNMHCNAKLWKDKINY